jgi:hypothetical protein
MGSAMNPGSSPEVSLQGEKRQTSSASSVLVAAAAAAPAAVDSVLAAAAVAVDAGVLAEDALDAKVDEEGGGGTKS